MKTNNASCFARFFAIRNKISVIGLSYKQESWQSNLLMNHRVDFHKISFKMSMRLLNSIIVFIHVYYGVCLYGVCLVKYVYTMSSIDEQKYFYSIGILYLYFLRSI